MKKFAIGAAVVFGTVLVPSASQAAFLNEEKIDVGTLPTPNSNVTDRDKSNAGVKQKNWLRILFSFRTDEIKAKSKYKSKDVYKWADDVTVEAAVMIPSLYKGKPSTALFTGKVTLAGVKYDKKLHMGRLFIPPHYIERYLRPGNSYPQKSGLKDFTVQLTFKDKSQNVVGMLFFYNNKSISFVDRAGKKIALAVKKKMEAPSTEIQKYEGVVVGPSETPWAFSKYDSYECIKPKGKQ